MITLPQFAPRQGLSAAVRAIFTTGVNGAWYDPSDINLTWRRNLLTYSEQFDNAAWEKQNVATAANQSVAPDGTVAADYLFESASTVYHSAVQRFTSQAGVAYTMSCYMKAGSRTFGVLNLYSGTYGDRYAVFDLSAGTVGATPSGVTASIVSVGSGWYRCVVSYTFATAVSAQANVHTSASSTYGSYEGDGTSGIYIWGAQLELGSTATPYQRITDGIKDYLDYKPLPVLYQDAAGTTPVTAVGQPVGLMLDKSKGLVLGSELVTNGTFDSNINGWTSAGGSQTWVSGFLQRNAGGSAVGSYQDFPTISGRWYKFSGSFAPVSGSGAVGIYAYVGGGFTTAAGAILVSGGSLYVLATSATTRVYLYTDGTRVANFDNISVRELPGNHAFNSSGNSANFPVLSARYNLLLATGTLSTQTVTTQATNYTLRFSGGGTVALSGASTGVYTAGVYTFNASAGSLIVTVAGLVSDADLRVTNDTLNQPAYQRVNTATDYDTVGFKPYLSFNGVNQWLQTNSIDFTYGDKMFVSAGVRKLGIDGIVTELSQSTSTNNGAFLLYTPSTFYRFDSKGSAQIIAAGGGGTPPITSVISGIGDIVGDQAILRVNGTQAATSAADQGTGNYGNYPLYIGARAGSSLWFNGRLYGLVVAGKAASAGEIANVERHLNSRTGAY